MKAEESITLFGNMLFIVMIIVAIVLAVSGIIRESNTNKRIKEFKECVEVNDKLYCEVKR